MLKLDAGMLGIVQGDEVLFSDFENEGSMWTGDGPREVRQAVSFAESFSADPNVMVAVSMFDASSNMNIRFDVQADGITPVGFDIVFRTWSDSKIARARVSWQAIGPIGVEEVWDI
jgi:glycogen debranching enzyme